MLPFMQALAGCAKICHVHAYPNAGLPNAMGGYDQKPDEFAKEVRGSRRALHGAGRSGCPARVRTTRGQRGWLLPPLYHAAHAPAPAPPAHSSSTLASSPRQVRQFADLGLVNMLGGCCGTTPDHIAALAREVASLKPRQKPVVTGIPKMVRAALFSAWRSRTRAPSLPPIMLHFCAGHSLAPAATASEQEGSRTHAPHAPPRAPRSRPAAAQMLSGLEAITVDLGTLGFVNLGERCNLSGTRAQGVQREREVLWAYALLMPHG